MFYGAYNYVRLSHVLSYLTADLEAVEQSGNRELRIAVFSPQKLDSNPGFNQMSGKSKTKKSRLTIVQENEGSTIMIAQRCSTDQLL